MSPNIRKVFSYLKDPMFRPLVLLLISGISMNRSVQNWWNFTDLGDPKNLERNLSKCQMAHGQVWDWTRASEEFEGILCKKKIKIYVLTEKKFWLCFEEQLFILYRDSLNKYSRHRSSAFVRNVDIEVQDFEVSKPRRISKIWKYVEDF